MLDPSSPERPLDLKAELASSLDDFRLSRGERQTLQALCNELDEPALAQMRQIAFDTARQSIESGGQPAAVLDWLDAIVGVLLKSSQRNATPAPWYTEALFTPGDDCAHRICQLVNACRDRLDICVFTITDDRITTSIQAAHERGVATRIISDADKTGDIGSDIDRLSASGIATRLDHSEYHMHNKFAIFDGRKLLTGSYNWTRGASECNQENLVITDDEKLVASFSRRFERLWTTFGGPLMDDRQRVSGGPRSTSTPSRSRVAASACSV